MSEQDYIEGLRRAWLSIFQQCLIELGEEVDSARCIMERQEAVAALRRVCSRFGDNDWEDDLYLSDIIDKHLARHLDN